MLVTDRSAYEQSIFCQVFHAEESGWRECNSCDKVTKIYGLHVFFFCAQQIVFLNTYLCFLSVFTVDALRPDL